MDSTTHEDKKKLKEKFLELYPHHKKDRIEICDNGEIWVHTGGAYPLKYELEEE
jgi:hypothetical protein